MHVPLVGSGVVPGGQHVPHDVICAGLQQEPSIVMPSLGFEHGVTQALVGLSLTWPDGQAGGGHMPVKLSGEKFAGCPLLLQMQLLTPLTWFGAGEVPEGQSQEKI
jgi:hypothetical protein